MSTIHFELPSRIRPLHQVGFAYVVPLTGRTSFTKIWNANGQDFVIRDGQRIPVEGHVMRYYREVPRRERYVDCYDRLANLDNTIE